MTTDYRVDCKLGADWYAVWYAHPRCRFDALDDLTLTGAILSALKEL